MEQVPLAKVQAQGEGWVAVVVVVAWGDRGLDPEGTACVPSVERPSLTSEAYRASTLSALIAEPLWSGNRAAVARF